MLQKIKKYDGFAGVTGQIRDQSTMTGGGGHLVYFCNDEMASLN
jgi:hypothetical protein